MKPCIVISAALQLCLTVFADEVPWISLPWEQSQGEDQCPPNHHLCLDSPRKYCVPWSETCPHDDSAGIPCLPLTDDCSRGSRTLLGWDVPHHGVNLAGWLVPRSETSPKLFDTAKAKDLFGLVKSLGRPTATGLINEHMGMFVQKHDFDYLKVHRVNSVRLGVGHWYVFDSPEYPSCPGFEERGACTMPHIKQALDWALKFHIKVVLSIEGAPGSQNGCSDSGRVGSVEWGNTTNIELTLKMVDKLMSMFGQHKALWAIDLLDLPRLSEENQHYLFWKRSTAQFAANVTIGTLQRYYVAAYQVVRKYSDSVTVIYTDAATSATLWENFMLSGFARYWPAEFREVERPKELAVYSKILRAVHPTRQLTTAWPSQLDRDVLRRRFGGIIDAWVAEMEESLQHILSSNHHHKLVLADWSFEDGLTDLKRLPQGLQETVMRRWGAAQLRLWSKFSAAFYFHSFVVSDLSGDSSLEDIGYQTKPIPADRKMCFRELLAHTLWPSTQSHRAPWMLEMGVLRTLLLLLLGCLVFAYILNLWATNTRFGHRVMACCTMTYCSLEPCLRMLFGTRIPPKGPDQVSPSTNDEGPRMSTMPSMRSRSDLGVDVDEEASLVPTSVTLLAGNSKLE